MTNQGWKNSPKTDPNSNCKATQRSPKSGKHTRRGNGGVSFGSERGEFQWLPLTWSFLPAISEAWRVFLGGKFHCWHGFDEAKQKLGWWRNSLVWFIEKPVIHYLFILLKPWELHSQRERSCDSHASMYLSSVAFCCVTYACVNASETWWHWSWIWPGKMMKYALLLSGSLVATHPKARLNYSIWGIYKHKLSKWEETEQRCELLLESCLPTEEKKGIVFLQFPWLMIALFGSLSNEDLRVFVGGVSNVKTASFHFNASTLVSKTGQ